MGTRSAMRRLRDDLARALEEAEPAEPKELFAALCARLSERRGRPVVLHLVEFPPQTASGLYLDMTDRDVICVQENTHPLHQLIIFGHEVWHMMAGHSSLHHEGGPAVAARLVAEGAHGTGGADGGPAGGGADGGSGPLESAVQHLAARTDFRQAQETEAETFGLELAAHLRGWLDRTPGPEPLSEVAERIQASLGHRQS